jgi:RNA polymerase sigma-70 factor (ECF subfamily)
VISSSGTIMPDSNTPQRLSQIETLWSVVCRAGGERAAGGVSVAQQQLLERYGKVAHRYLLGALRDADAADELSQEFALRFVQGSLRGADPQRGRFRDYLKGVLIHLIGDHHRRRRRNPLPLAAEFDPATSAAPMEADDAFLVSWRDELLNRGWKALLQLEEQSGQRYHTVLRFRAEHAELRSEQMATELGLLLGHSVTAGWVRQTLHRARGKFAAVLIDEVTQTLVDPTLEELEQELIDIGLHEYCRPALEGLAGARDDGLAR